MKLDCPIFPVGIIGTDEIQPPDAKMPKFFAGCQIKIGRPLRPERYRGRGAEHIAWRSMTDEVMYEIRELTGQTYVNRYAGATAETEPTLGRRVASVVDRIPEVILRQRVDRATAHARRRQLNRSARTLANTRRRTSRRARNLARACRTSRSPSPTVPSANWPTMPRRSTSPPPSAPV